MTALVSHYEVLSLPQSLLDESKDDQIPTVVKQAYHRALLRHHPDKAPLKPSSSSSPSTTTASPAYTIDQITTAYTTLSQPSPRATYNAYLRTLPTNTTSSTPSTFQTGIETLDLDDLASEESASPPTTTTTWFKPCRCGNERGFVFGEADLEEAGDLGELIVGCQDCSLWLRVCFAVVEEEEDDGVAEEEGLADEIESGGQNAADVTGVMGKGMGAHEMGEQSRPLGVEKQRPG